MPPLRKNRVRDQFAQTRGAVGWHHGEKDVWQIRREQTAIVVLVAERCPDGPAANADLAPKVFAPVEVEERLSPEARVNHGVGADFGGKRLEAGSHEPGEQIASA